MILNRVASDRHERLLREALASSGLPVYGAIRRTEGIVTPSRHLGLIPAAEREAIARQAIGRMGALIAASCDLDALLVLAAARPGAHGPALGAPRPYQTRHRRAPVVAVAGGAAFTFGYTEQTELLEAAGSRVARFDPLRDEDLPAGTAGLILGGGFPEVHAAALSANERLRERVAALAAPRRAGRRRMRGAALPGADPGRTAHVRRPRRAGHDDREADPGLPAGGGRDGFGAGPGRRRGARPRVPPHRDRPGRRRPACLAVRLRHSSRATSPDPVVASYLHTHWAGHPAAAARFTAACAKVPPHEPAERNRYSVNRQR